ncbi:MAG: TonB-dependent receptor [Blastocatellia bacterium]|nr:TonB-dependent receptor [Blastocatellia bacterium]MCS7157812.1 TonB-dependent receptor [Blastocatellia bacterium]MDW8168112.1 TonB-dependent receptor [Acidobacteriota bacterium]MDW8257640.1 TonB-dependent receptor [Acidobacteriota bacterium]
MRCRFVLRTCALVVLFLGLLDRGWGQTPTGAVQGLVTDERRGVIQRAVVMLLNRATGEVRRTESQDDGIYRFDHLPPGEYELTVEAPGFAPTVRRLLVRVGTTTSADVTLRVGSPSETVEITAEPSLLDRVSYKVDGVITREKIEALPLNGRNFLQLAMLEPGVSVTISNPGQANNFFNVSIGGAQAALTRLTVDGGNIVDPITGGAAQNFSTETIQEFQISTFNFDLSTGITSVGAINIVSRSGSNDWHGSGFLFYRDRYLAAYPVLVRDSQNPNPFFRRAQYGGSLGGPIRRNRAFLFGNVEWLTQDAALSIVHTGWEGFRHFNTVAQSPYDGTVATVRTDFRWNDRHTLFLRYSRDDNRTFAPDDANTLPSNWRVNHNDDDNAQLGLVSILRSNVLNDLRFNYHRIRNRNRLPTAQECPPAQLGCLGLGGPQVRVDGSNLRFGNSFNAPQDRFIDRFQTSDNLYWQRGRHRLQVGGEWEYLNGRGRWAFLEPALVVLHDPRNVHLVNQLVAQIPLPPAVRSALTIPLPPVFARSDIRPTLAEILQLPFAVAFVGLGDPSQPPPFRAKSARRNHRLRFYGQDAWTLRRTFTLTFGLSYQYETNLLNHDLPKPPLLAPIIGRLDPPGKDKNNLAPALGFAWDINGQGRTVLRGGFGIYYDTVLFVTRLTERGIIGPLGTGRVPLSSSFFRNPFAFPQIPGLLPPLNQINPPLGTPLQFTSIPTKFTGAQFLQALSQQIPDLERRFQELGRLGVTALDFFKTGSDLLDPNLEVAYAEHANVGIRRELPYQMQLAADVVLRLRRHTLFQTDRNLYNRAEARGGAVIPRCLGAHATDPSVLCSNGPISLYQSSGRERYLALLTKLEKRFSHRHQFTVSYALSSLTGYFPTEDLTDWFAHRGPLDRDARHRLTVSAIVDLPWGMRASLIAVYASAPPFNARVRGNLDLNGDGTFGDTLPGLTINTLGRGTGRAELRQLVERFNREFAGREDAHGAIIPPLVLPPRFAFGDSFHSHDVRLAKTFRLRERYAVEVLVEVFNLFNISNLGGFTPTLDAGQFGPNGEILPPTIFNFGQPTLKAGHYFGTGGPRAFQLGLRVSF